MCRKPTETWDKSIFRPEIELTERSGILYPVEDGDLADREFLAGYRRIRREEGRGSDDPGFYLRLPQGEFTGERAAEWRERKRSLDWLLGRYGAQIGGKRILDAGAGNCWLTHHLARMGAEVVALDIDDGDYDGLGAGRHMIAGDGSRFTRLCGSFESMPFASAVFDLVIFNGALHYARDPGAVIADGVGICRPGGEVIVMDTPLYHSDRSGRAMVAERGGPTRARYLTYRRIARIAHELGLPLQIIHRTPRPWRILRLLWHRLRLGREPASMPWILFSVPKR